MSRADLSDPAVLRQFRLRLAKALDACHAALGGAPGQYGRVLDWLQGEQQAYWTKQLHRREEAYTTARLLWLEAEAEVRASRNGRGGGRQSADEEKRAMDKVRRQRDEAQDKLEAVKRWQRRLQLDGDPLVHICVGHELAIRELGTLALRRLDRMVQGVEEYLALQAAGPTGPLPALPEGLDEAPLPPPTPGTKPCAE